MGHPSNGNVITLCKHKHITRAITNEIIGTENGRKGRCGESYGPWWF